MRVASVCSGIGAPEVAWSPLGFEFVACAEIEPFPSAVLAHHFPGVPNLGDFTAIGPDAGSVDVLVGGTPCQSFSVTGLRKGMADDRGNLALEFLRLAGRLRAEWVVWENVPGVLSTNGGRDFGAFLGGLAELGYGFAYRVLDAQHFGVPQRRRRVFVVGHLGDWRRAAAVLFERHSLSGDPPPGREARAGVAPSVTPGARRASGNRAGEQLTIAERERETTPEPARCLTSHGGRFDWDTENFVASPLKTRPFADRGCEHHNLITHSLRAEGFDASEDGTGRGTPLVPVAYSVQSANSNVRAHHACAADVSRCLDSAGMTGNQGGTVVACTLPASNGGVSSGYHPVVPVIAYGVQEDNQNGVTIRETAGSLRADAPGTQPCGTLVYQCHGSNVGPMGTVRSGNGNTAGGVPFAPDISFACQTQDRRIGQGWNGNLVAPVAAVRRLTPRECERLQGFHDNWTLVPYRGKPAADGPRYKAIGNSMAVPVMRWLGRRLMEASS